MNLMAYFNRNHDARYIDSSTMLANARHRGTYEEQEFFKTYDLRLYPVFEDSETLAAVGDLRVDRLYPIIADAIMHNNAMPLKNRKKYLTNRELAAALGRYQGFEAWQNNYVIQFLQAYQVIVS